LYTDTKNVEPEKNKIIPVKTEATETVTKENIWKPYQENIQ
jgi:hypothetical protein